VPASASSTRVAGATPAIVTVSRYCVWSQATWLGERPPNQICEEFDQLQPWHSSVSQSLLNGSHSNSQVKDVVVPCSTTCNVSWREWVVGHLQFFEGSLSRRPSLESLRSIIRNTSSSCKENHRTRQSSPRCPTRFAKVRVHVGALPKNKELTVRTETIPDFQKKGKCYALLFFLPTVPHRSFAESRGPDRSRTSS
jgi:hypothetical protein